MTIDLILPVTIFFLGFISFAQIVGKEMIYVEEKSHSKKTSH